MASTTPKYGLPYPEGPDPFLVAGDMHKLATATENALSGLVGGVTGTPLIATVRLNFRLDAGSYGKGAANYQVNTPAINYYADCFSSYYGGSGGSLEQEAHVYHQQPGHFKWIWHTFQSFTVPAGGRSYAVNVLFVNQSLRVLNQANKGAAAKGATSAVTVAPDPAQEPPDTMPVTQTVTVESHRTGSGTTDGGVVDIHVDPSQVTATP